MSDATKAAPSLIAAHEQPDGRTFYKVVCPGCGADLSKVSLGRIMQTPYGPLAEIWHPLQCSECGQRLLAVPSAIVRAAGKPS
jgi:hypothetical protein